MKQIRIILIGMLATFMLKQSFYITPHVSQKNIWIIIGAAILIIQAIQIYWQSNNRAPVLNSAPTIPQVGVDLRLEMLLRGLIQKEGKLEAIKRLREETGMGLKEAKDFIDTID